ncbi:hypothetical protein CEXT_276791 [Caerostris extrusa]|uniref:Secreted protein n=1 Tax=Caerostris extrusa TaxID=172846 RepID=A0AAV4P866_CAEEX|nr:hypothetical protein CEXT_276791 [Caerostris extrusa]
MNRTLRTALSISSFSLLSWGVPPRPAGGWNCGPRCTSTRSRWPLSSRGPGWPRNRVADVHVVESPQDSRFRV